MSMSKKDFIALADAIIWMREHNYPALNDMQIEHLATFCQSQNSQFMRERWLAYIAGECGPNGGTRK